MSFAGGFIPNYCPLSETGTGERITRENWGIVGQTGEFAGPVQKRRKTTSLLAKKRAKMTRGDENITDEVAKKAAVEILDQLQDSPGVIKLNVSCPQTANLCPIPDDFKQIEKSEWSINRLREGQLSSFLAQEPKNFESLGIPKIRKGDVGTQILPRQMNLKEAMVKLKKDEKWTDEYVGFASAVANLLRRMDVETGERIARSIAEVIENEANTVINK